MNSFMIQLYFIDLFVMWWPSLFSFDISDIGYGYLLIFQVETISLLLHGVYSLSIRNISTQVRQMTTKVSKLTLSGPRSIELYTVVALP